MNNESQTSEQELMPPLGVMPEYLWLEYIQKEEPERHAIPMSKLIHRRICDLTRAINDYAHFNQGYRQLDVVEIWTEELLRRIRDRKLYGTNF